MFICTPCLEENYNNWSFRGSYGRCEICEEIASCHDIPSSRLKKKAVEEDQ